jgi:hypothetical protein
MRASSPKTKQKMLEDVFDDARTGMPPGVPEGAMCVQRFDDSLNSAIHTTYRISLRSSSMREPRDPLLKVLTCFMWVPLRQMTLQPEFRIPSPPEPEGQLAGSN